MAVLNIFWLSIWSELKIFPSVVALDVLYRLRSWNLICYLCVWSYWYVNAECLFTGVFIRSMLISFKMMSLEEVLTGVVSAFNKYYKDFSPKESLHRSELSMISPRYSWEDDSEFLKTFTWNAPRAHCSSLMSAMVMINCHRYQQLPSTTGGDGCLNYSLCGEMQDDCWAVFVCREMYSEIY